MGKQMTINKTETVPETQRILPHDGNWTVWVLSFFNLPEVVWLV
jgi:hypothetical protein